jgi:hypothetical protein
MITEVTTNNIRLQLDPTMAFSLRSSRLPQCTSCVRRLTIGARDGQAPLRQLQTRGKKTSANQSDVLKVRLLHDIPRFGKAGE